MKAWISKDAFSSGIYQTTGRIVRFGKYRQLQVKVRNRWFFFLPDEFSDSKEGAIEQAMQQKKRKIKRAERIISYKEAYIKQIEKATVKFKEVKTK